MALAVGALCDNLPLPTAASTAERHGRNDAFSFWKLSEAWRPSLEAAIAESESASQHFLFEEYLSGHRRQPPTPMLAYYIIRRLIPEQLRHRLNSAAIRVRRKRDFPSWPSESTLVTYWRQWLQVSLAQLHLDDGWHIAFWPLGFKCGIVLTHDVENTAGMRRMERMADLEERYNFRSAWNLPLAQFDIDWNLVERLKRRGFEFGAHGLCHDGRLFRSRANFRKLAPVLARLASLHELKGFRAPSTLRRIEWISQLPFDFDCSFADSDPYEPQSGGTCSLFPFFLGEMVELPYTLPQDHTLIHLLRRKPLPVWEAKAQWIESLGGMILTLIHPDYCGSGRNLDDYEGLLKQLNDLPSAWRALPSEVATWWRQRDQLKLTVEGDFPVIEGLAAERATARRLSEEPLVG